VLSLTLSSGSVWIRTWWSWLASWGLGGDTLGGRSATELSANITKLNQALTGDADIRRGLGLGGRGWLVGAWFFGILLLVC
jgi:hypothetical protein